MVQGQEQMRIGRFAAEAGVSVDAIRFYERRGVLSQAPRTSAGYRTFGPSDLDRILMARRLQSLGLTVEEVVDTLAAHDEGGATCASERWRLEEVESRIEAQLAELRRTKRMIREALSACDAGECRLSPAPAR